ncbi:RNA-binding protein 8A-A-like [Hydractinia symbiolongicarpus]|uniref:RNA-binding protein 8A-A-like n=1 Tax=Hydractinia symbiolongicarpus TaxID=13093 RepID=UPI00255110D7|nr:RNA-binding protein 8A-A-like [Hydractinia symbiolongicarpus]XP_057302901.1 RNA-binding protein 8A-A-like [Hydractinia symbiolongicarpus]
MAEVLEVDIDEKDEFMYVDDDDEVKRLKKNKKRKGRGFKDSNDIRTVEPFDAIEDEAGANIQGPQKSVEGWILFVTNVHEEAQEDDLHNVFGDYGNIRNMHLNLDRRTGFLKGYALVEYDTFKEAQNALDATNGEELLGQKIAVDWAFVKGPAKGKKKKGGRR